MCVHFYKDFTVMMINIYLKEIPGLYNYFGLSLIYLYLILI